MMRKFEIVPDKYRKNPDYEITLPIRSTKYSAGYDFYLDRNIEIPSKNDEESGGKKVYWSDICAKMEKDEVLKVYIRSSMAMKKGLHLVNEVGIIDCVPAGTKISTPEGYKMVEDIFRSDKKEMVLSYNEAENKIEDDICSEMWIVNDLDLIYIETENGNNIEIPINKKIFTKRGWIKAKNLNIYDEVLSI